MSGFFRSGRFSVIVATAPVCCQRKCLGLPLFEFIIAQVLGGRDQGRLHNSCCLFTGIPSFILLQSGLVKAFCMVLNFYKFPKLCPISRVTSACSTQCEGLAVTKHPFCEIEFAGSPVERIPWRQAPRRIDGRRILLNLELAEGEELGSNILHRRST